jgi:hypothetical protein
LYNIVAVGSKVLETEQYFSKDNLAALAALSSLIGPSKKKTT